MFSPLNIFDDLENDVIQLSRAHNCNCLLLAGDFNARTGTLSDIDLDDLEQIQEETHLSAFFDLDVNTTQMLDVNTTPDKTINIYGCRLISMCKRLNIVILNGIIGTDKSQGKLA